MKTVSTTAFKEFTAACAQSGCPVCRIAEKETQRYLGSLFYEYVNDTGVRKELRSSLGFCNLHTWQTVEQNLGNALGFAILYEDLTGHVLERLGRVNSSVVIASRLRPTQECPACRVWANASQASIDLLLNQINDPELMEALHNSDGLCIPHLTQSTSLAPDSLDISPLLSLHKEKIASLQKELKEFIRKNDHRFMHEPSLSEADSWVRALRLMAGLKKGMHD